MLEQGVVMSILHWLFIQCALSLYGDLSRDFSELVNFSSETHLASIADHPTTKT